MQRPEDREQSAVRKRTARRLLRSRASAGGCAQTLALFPPPRRCNLCTLKVTFVLKPNRKARLKRRYKGTDPIDNRTLTVIISQSFYSVFKSFNNSPMIDDNNEFPQPKDEVTGALPLEQADAHDAVSPRIQFLSVDQIRRDGNTQHRVAVNTRIIAEYAKLLAEGAAFPPVTVWFDGENYWLSDGFQRVAASEAIGRETIAAEVYNGTLDDAKWASYGANSKHGLRWTASDVQNVLSAAIRHPNARRLSNMEIARHLKLPEATVRRWRCNLSSSGDDDGIRIVKRGSSTYEMKTGMIGTKRGARRQSGTRHLRDDLSNMKTRSSPQTRRLLNILGKWLFGSLDSSACLLAIERLIQEWAVTQGPSTPVEIQSANAPPYGGRLRGCCCSE